MPGEHGQFHVEPQLGAIVARLRTALALAADAGASETDPRLQREHAAERPRRCADVELA